MAASGTPRVRYRADGVRLSFEIPFALSDPSSLAVFLDAAPQAGGYTVSGCGEAGGGTVRFAGAPAEGVVVTLARQVPLARRARFEPGGGLTAAALNGEFDRVMAGLQQVASDNGRALRLDPTDGDGALVLPPALTRAGKALAFDEAGGVQLVDHGATVALPQVLAGGAGAVWRSASDKIGEAVSVRDYGAVGDGLADDTAAFLSALAANGKVRVPEGRFRLTATLALAYGQVLAGAGQTSVLMGADVSGPVIELPYGYAQLRDLRLEGGETGILLRGRLGPCVQNRLSDLTLWDMAVGLDLDGYEDAARPCYWNHIERVLIARPTGTGLRLRRSGAGDTPNANRFTGVRVYSLGTAISGDGIAVLAGAHMNCFTDCEVNLSTGAAACIRIGAGAADTCLINPYTETLGTVANLLLEAGSSATSVVNLHAQSAGAAIEDHSGGSYSAINAGWPLRNRLAGAEIGEMKVEGLRYATRFLDPAAGGPVSIDAAAPIYLISAFGGAVEARLPAAADAEGAVLTIKKQDTSQNAVTVTEEGGPGPDARQWLLGNRYDFLTVCSNGAGWWVLAGNPLPAGGYYYEGAGLYEPDMTKSVYTVSAYAGALEVRLPAPGDARAAGRTVSIKKIDVSDNPVTITQSGGVGPDGAVVILGSRYDAATFYSNGAEWFVLASSTARARVAFREVTGTVSLDLTRRFHAISASAGAVTVQLPAPDAAAASGREVLIKKTDPSANTVTITQLGGGGPDGAEQVLGAQYQWLAALCNGSQWYITAKG
ncbi:glycosyl hydrolase family 28-related protein [Radicibacter daui]|uniref:glycosyl hydrolase family 28-related protein n=1 Tax=Radicibacter daui TaxID=3064829 RepID=UPI004046A744